MADERKRINKVIAEGPDVLFGIFNKVDQVFGIGGGHPYVDEIVGSMPASVRLNGRDGPPIPLQEGLCIERAFDRFIVSFDYALFQDDRRVPLRTPATRVTLYATHGPFVLQKPPKPYGVHPGFSARFDCDATTTPKLFYADMLSEFSAFNPNPEELFGQGGCTVVLKNDDAGNELYLKYTDAGDLAPARAATQRNWYALGAGQSVSLVFESLIRRTVRAFVTSVSGLYVATLSGTCKYSWIVSRSPVFGPTSSGYQGGDAAQPT